MGQKHARASVQDLSIRGVWAPIEYSFLTPLFLSKSLTIAGRIVQLWLNIDYFTGGLLTSLMFYLLTNLTQWENICLY